MKQAKDGRGDKGSMYQFYYAKPLAQEKKPEFCLNVRDVFAVSAVRPAMWEEHCLECSAPLCFENCVHYQARSDGRCMRFANGMHVYPHVLGCCGEGMHVRFRKWANMMTIVFPAMMEEQAYSAMAVRNKKLGKGLKLLLNSPLPVSIRWPGVRTVEYIRRRGLRKLAGSHLEPDAFIFHGYSHYTQPFQLMLEIYDDHTPVFKTALKIEPGENLLILDKQMLDCACWTPDHLVKIYPENDLEAELDILWCDFVQGKRIEAAIPAAKVKCVVWDLDGTLWKDILIETENPDALTVRPEVMQVIRALDERGIVQSVASKNDHEAAWPVLERLGIAQYFLYPQIHWHAKSGSIREIAAQLNIGMDTFALIDDSVFEREQVKAALPQVRTYDAADAEAILTLPEFDVPVTPESRKRREMYQAEEKRNSLRKAENTDIVEFLRRCNLRLSVFEPQTQEEILRCYELIVRTNQLNMSGRKYTREEFDQVLNKENRTNFAMHCEDDFGSYGIVGFGQYHVEDGQLVFDEFAMSCRVAGKYVESALFAYLLKCESCAEGRFDVIKTKKNALLRNTLERVGFFVCEESNEKVTFRFGKELLHADLVNV